MTALDLSTTHPRKARAELGGITFLPRSIDKARALLPGGNAHGYTIDGFTSRMLETLGIAQDAFATAVADAHDDAGVVQFVTAHAVSGGIAEWNKWILEREVYGGDRAEAIAENPWLADHPEITKSIDFLQFREDHGLDDD